MCSDLKCAFTVTAVSYHLCRSESACVALCMCAFLSCVSASLCAIGRTSVNTVCMSAKVGTRRKWLWTVQCNTLENMTGVREEKRGCRENCCCCCYYCCCCCKRGQQKAPEHGRHSSLVGLWVQMHSEHCVGKMFSLKDSSGWNRRESSLNMWECINSRGVLVLHNTSAPQKPCASSRRPAMPKHFLKLTLQCSWMAKI